MKKAILILTMVLLANVSHGRDLSEERALQQRIKDVINRVVDINKKPSPSGSPRAARIARNSYRNCCSEPRVPRTIWREPNRPPFPTGHKRFFNGIPSGR